MTHPESARVVQVSNGDEEWDYRAFGRLLTRLREEAGFGSDSELAEHIRTMNGGIPRFNSSTISKWRAGSPPSPRFLRAVARAVHVAPMRLFLASGVIRPSDSDDRPIDPVYDELLALDATLESHEVEAARTDLLFQLRSHVLSIIGGTQLQAEELAREAAKKPPPRWRRRS